MDDRNAGKTSRKPLVPLAETRIELRPRRARRAGPRRRLHGPGRARPDHQQAERSAGGRPEERTPGRVPRPGERRRRERSAGHGAAPRGGTRRPERATATEAGPADAHGGRRHERWARRRLLGADATADGAGDRAARRVRSTCGSMEACSRGRGNPTAGQVDVQRGPSISYIEGPRTYVQDDASPPRIRGTTRGVVAGLTPSAHPVRRRLRDRRTRSRTAAYAAGHERRAS